MRASWERMWALFRTHITFDPKRKKNHIQDSPTPNLVMVWRQLVNDAPELI